jgi:Flp pilus assembly protein TadG
MKPHQLEKSREGQSLVEMAISVFLIVGLLILTVDAGRLLLSYIAVQGAAEEGAIYGSTDPNDEDIEIRVRNSSTGMVDLSSEVLTEVEVPDEVYCEGDLLVVTVTHHFYPIMPGGGSFDIVVSARSTVLLSEPGC